MRLTAEKRNELSRATHAKAISGAMHDVAIFIGVLVAADKAVEIWSRSRLEKGILIIAAFCLAYLIFHRAKDWKSMKDLEDELARDEKAEGETDADED